MLVGVLLMLSVLGVLVFTIAAWAHEQLLDDAAWEATSRTVMSQDAVRDAVATALVDQTYDLLGARGQLPAVQALKPAAYRRARMALDREEFLDAWGRSNRAAHAQLMQVVRSESEIIASSAGAVHMDLAHVTNAVADRIGFAALDATRLPTRLTTVTLPQTQPVARSIEALRLIDRYTAWVGAAAAALLVVAVLLARGIRLQAIAYWCAGVAAAGIVVHVLLQRLTRPLAESLTELPEWRRAIVNVIEYIATPLMQAANTMLIAGGIAFVVLLVGAHVRQRS